ncbi:hypothetical protein [Sphingomonas crocodyli]|nr:hypothetical protein [Sphingomonas crocodyli]
MTTFFATSPVAAGIRAFVALGLALAVPFGMTAAAMPDLNGPMFVVWF